MIIMPIIEWKDRDCRYEKSLCHLRNNPGVCVILKNRDAETCIIYKLIEKTGLS